MGVGYFTYKRGRQEIGLGCASYEAVNTMLKRAEEALSTYDEVPYTFLQHDKKRPVPVFSQGKRREARELDKEVKKRKLSYSSFPSFNPNTGENLANSPKKILEMIRNGTFFEQNPEG